jgi:TfoX/Sxy family transcriptional regulator of competence genes
MELDEKLLNRIRESIVNLSDIEEKIMFGGVCFMIDGKLCIGVFKDEMLCRIDPVLDTVVLEQNGIRPMDSSGKSMKGFVFIGEEAMKTKKEFDYWIGLSLEYNPRAKASKRKKKSRKEMEILATNKE